MILTCPSCATSYFTPDEAIGPGGRTVRCKSCQKTWRATLEEPLELSVAPPQVAVAAAEPAGFGKRDEAASSVLAESLAETPAPELPKAFRARAEHQRRLRRAAAHGAVWAGIAASFAVLLGAAWLFRVDVVEMAPRTAGAYAAVGLTVNPTGLEFEAVNARPSPDDPGQVIISGALRNVREDERVAPPVRVALLDAEGAEIGFAVVRIDAAPVLPGKTQGWTTTIADPGAKGQGVGVAFILDAAAPKPGKGGDHATGGTTSHADADHADEAPAPRPLPGQEPAGLRPALPAGPDAPMTMQPIDAVPMAEAQALDSHAAEAVSASHG